MLGGERRGEHGDRRREGVPARRCRAREPRLRVGREWADAALAARLRPAGRAGRRGRRLHRQRAGERPFRHRVGGLNYREPARPGISSTARSPVSPRYGRCPEIDSRPRSVGRHPSARPSPRLRDGAAGAPRSRLRPAPTLRRPARPSAGPTFARPRRASGRSAPPAALARCPLGLHPPPWPAVPVRPSAPDPGPASPVAALAPRRRSHPAPGPGAGRGSVDFGFPCVIHSASLCALHGLRGREGLPGVSGSAYTPPPPTPRRTAPG